MYGLRDDGPAAAAQQQGIIPELVHCTSLVSRRTTACVYGWYYHDIWPCVPAALAMQPAFGRLLLRIARRISAARRSKVPIYSRELAAVRQQRAVAPVLARTPFAPIFAENGQLQAHCRPTAMKVWSKAVWARFRAQIAHENSETAKYARAGREQKWWWRNIRVEFLEHK